MTDSLSPALSPPPRRPHKSRLRTLDPVSTNSYSSTDDDRSSKSIVESPTPSILSPISPPEKSKYRSRFTEHFEAAKKSSIDRPELLNHSQSMTTISTTANALKKMSQSSTSTASSSELNLPLDPLMTTTTATKRVQLTSSTSTPLQLPHSPMKSGARRFASSGSILTSNSRESKLPPSATAPVSLNRADVIITRLESWLSFIKSITSWVEEVSKINMASSKGYYQRAYPFLDESSAISTTTTTTTDDLSTITRVRQNVNQTILTVQAGFQVLTMQIATEQKDFANALDKDHISRLHKLRKECKHKINNLKNDPHLALDELLRRAEVTRAKMTHLSRCCKQADKHQGQVEMDPWVANLLVLRQLKREVDEENRLRHLMIPIQKDAKSFEERLVATIKPTIEFCYQTLALGAWDGSDDKETAPFQLVMEQIMPSYDWDQFVEMQKKDLVPEDHPTKDYLKINYPNKFHPQVMTLLKGKMERKLGVRKQFIERTYVLSQGGYLHEFEKSDKVLPEKTIYIPSCTIVPSIDIAHLSIDMTELLENPMLDKSNTFEICKPSTGVLQRDKVSVFRTSNREEMITWCRLLVHIASGVSLSSFVMKEDDIFLPNSSSIAFDDSENHPTAELKRQKSSSSTIKKGGNRAAVAAAMAAIKVESKESSPRSSPAGSPARSLRSVESFNEPALMKKRRSTKHHLPPLVPPSPRKFRYKEYDDLKTPTATTMIPPEYLLKDEDCIRTPNSSILPKEYQDVETPDTPVIPPEYLPNKENDSSTDAESFVTAQFNDDTIDQEEDEEHPILIDDYFHKNQDDTASITSTSTAKGHTSQAHTPSATESIRRSPSLINTAFDDAQSSLYFSSTSAPPSPTQSDRSSIVSIPHFELGEENNRDSGLTVAQIYKATLSMNFDADE